MKARLEVEIAKTEDLIPDPENAMGHPDEEILALMASLAQFGQQIPIVIDQNRIVRKGNATLEAAKRLGWEEIQYVQTDLMGVDAMAFAIVDNKTGKMSQWNANTLNIQLHALQQQGWDLKNIGWSQSEIPQFNVADAFGGEVADSAARVKGIRLTENQRRTVMPAIEKIRAIFDDEDISEGRCIELICIEFLNNVDERSYE